MRNIISKDLSGRLICFGDDDIIRHTQPDTGYTGYNIDFYSTDENSKYLFTFFFDDQWLWSNNYGGRTVYPVEIHNYIESRFSKPDGWKSRYTPPEKYNI